MFSRVPRNWTIGAAFDQWVQGCAIFVLGGLAVMLLVWGLAALGVPGPVIVVLPLVALLIVVRLVLNQIFD
jgi:hypothetical protein